MRMGSLNILVRQMGGDGHRALAWFYRLLGIGRQSEMKPIQRLLAKLTRISQVITSLARLTRPLLV